MDYERVLIGSPNSSYVWIRYMAYCVTIGELEKARAVAEHALKRIAPAENKEKFNIWTAFLNIEILKGNKDTLVKVFERSLAYSNPKRMQTHLGYLFGQAGQHDRAVEAYKDALNKYNVSKKVLQEYLDYLVNTKHDLAAFRATLSERMKSLPRKKHLQVLKHAAILEYKYGDPERARTMFEGIVGSHPKQIDLWLVYIDMEMKVGNDTMAIRKLFDRCITLSFSPKSMKAIFKKYMLFEQTRGDQKGMERVTFGLLRIKV